MIFIMIQILSKIRIHSNKLLLIGNRLDGSYAEVLVSMGSKVISTSSSNSRLINWDNSSIWVSNKLGVKVEGTSITIGGNWGSNWGNWGSSNSWSSRVSSNWRSSNSNWGSSSINCSLGSKMISTGSSNSWLINRDNSSIGESLEAIKTLCRGCGNTGGENLKFYS